MANRVIEIYKKLKSLILSNKPVDLEKALNDFQSSEPFNLKSALQYNPALDDDLEKQIRGEYGLSCLAVNHVLYGGKIDCLFLLLNHGAPSHWKLFSDFVASSEELPPMGILTLERATQSGYSLADLPPASVTDCFKFASLSSDTDKAYFAKNALLTLDYFKKVKLLNLEYDVDQYGKPAHLIFSTFLKQASEVQSITAEFLDLDELMNLNRIQSERQNTIRSRL